MENEFQILKSLHKSGITTQRDISKSMGISLGSVNVLIRRLTNKGMIRVEPISTRANMYIVTPKGIKITADETYKCIIESCRFINEVNSKIDYLINSKFLRKVDEIVLLCKKDEIYELIESKLNERKMRYSIICKVEDINKIEDVSKIMILIWQPEYINSIKDIKTQYTNLLDYI